MLRSYETIENNGCTSQRCSRYQGDVMAVSKLERLGFTETVGLLSSG
jgi:hypothetical protein